MDIPIDILYYIFFLVDMADYPNLARTCQHFSTLLMDEKLWQKHCVYNQIDKLEGTYLETYKMSISKWYQDDMGKVSELKRKTILEVSSTAAPSLSISRNKFSTVNNKLSVKLLSTASYIKMGFASINQNQNDFFYWQNYSSVCIVYKGFLYFSSWSEFKKVMVGDVVTTFIDLDNKCFNIRINEVVAFTGKLSGYTDKSLISYVILHEGEIELL